MTPDEPAHDHDHDHDHDSSRAQMAQRVAALVAALETRGVVSDAELTAMIERFAVAAGPGNGARLVARAWTDADFKTQLLADANAAIDAFGLDMTHWAPVKLVAVENTAAVHNVIVCTLCSCYPIALLGPSPQWYKSEAYRSRVVREPRAVLAEFGVVLDGDVEVRVWDSTAELRYIVVPQRPRGTAEFDETALAGLVTRDSLIGAAVPSA